LLGDFRLEAGFFISSALVQLLGFRGLAKGWVLTCERIWRHYCTIL
jgi:hypothetical protein